MFLRDDYDGLVRELAIAREKNIEGALLERLKRELKDAGWEVAVRIVQGITQMDMLPRNLLGAVTRARRMEAERKEREVLERQKWTASEDCTTAKEWVAFWRLLVQIIRAHRAGVVQSTECPGLHCGQPDFPERYRWAWEAKSFPRTPSPLVDTLLVGYRRAYIDDTIAEYCVKFREEISGNMNFQPQRKEGSA